MFWWVACAVCHVDHSSLAGHLAGCAGDVSISMPKSLKAIKRRAGRLWRFDFKPENWIEP
jgi:hypothetical protein